MDRQDAAGRLLGIFLEELDDRVRAMNADLLALEGAPADADRIRSLFRAAHTIKGAAAAVGVVAVEQACHALEEVLAAVRDGRLEPEPGLFPLLYGSVDALADAGRRLRAGDGLAGAPVAELPARLREVSAPPRGSAPRTRQPHPSAPPPDVPPADTPAGGPLAAPTVRVRAAQLDALLATSGELLALSRRAGAHAAALDELDGLAAQRVRQWEREWRRLRRECEDAGVPPAVLHSLEEAGGAIRDLRARVRGLAAGALRDARQFGRTGGDLLAQARRLRMRPLREALDGLERTVRDLASQAGKEVRLAVTGDEVEVDRAVLDALREAILPVVRNAVDHGIEPPAARERAGKPRQGTITVAGSLHADRVQVRVSDDGAGLDSDALRRRLEERGVQPPADDAALASMLLAGGLSSRREASTISGRGVGLDIARAAMLRVRGRVALRWRRGGGASVELECPPSLASVRAVLAGVGGHLFAIPTAGVVRTVRLRAGAVGSVEGRAVLQAPEGVVPLVPLARVLGSPLVTRPVEEGGRAVLVGLEGRLAALLVDELVGEEELIARPIRTGAVTLPHVAGAAVLGTGGVALLLDLHALVEAGLRSGGAASVVETPAPEPARRRVLVADDSLTTRALEQSVLEAAGYEVATAVDGLDAWRILQERPVDAVVSDVEMPRMDGFALCEAIRASPRLRELPVVLVTALESAEHRARGLEAGADAYVAKSSFDQEQLLTTLQQLIG